MLVVPNQTTLTAWAEGQKIKADNFEALLQLPETQSKMDREVRTTLRDQASFEVPKRLLLLPHDFTVESGELTPTLKIKRRVVEQHHRLAIEALYAQG
jgi:long-chain acyl-CoA synthetase